MRGKSLYETNNYCNITNKERKEENKFIYSRNSIMIGLSFYSNSIRAVRLKKGKKGFVIEQVANAPLYEGDIVQGRIKNSDSVVEALNELKEELKLKDDEEVFVSIPNAVAKIDSIVVENDVTEKIDILDRIPLLGDKKSFDIDIAYVSGSYRIPLPVDETTPTDNDGNFIEQYKLMKTVSYCAVPKKVITDYSSILTENGFTVIMIEPKALPIVRYIRDDATQPFALVDIEYDFSSYVIFSERNGLMLMNSPETGSNSLINIEYNEETGEVVNQTVYHENLLKICQRVKMAEEYYKENKMSESDTTINQILFLDNEYDFVIQEMMDIYPNIDVLSAEGMLPTEVSEKFGKNVDTSELNFYYIAMVTGINRLTDSIEEKNNFIEANLAPVDCVQNAQYLTLRKKILIALMSLATLSGLYMAGVVGNNFMKINAKQDAGKVNQELKQKYDDTKKQEATMKENIVKYNTIANNKFAVAPIIDTIVVNKPQNVSLTAINYGMKGKTKRVIIECLAEGSSAPLEFLNALKGQPGFDSAEILNQQTRANKTAFQINVPIN